MRELIQCITNNVTMNDCANVLLAVGASPTMAHHIMEVEEIQSGCDGLVLNLGATDDYEAMKVAIKTAVNRNHPIVIDPVGVGGSTFRRDFFFELCKIGKPSVVRGNYSEIKALADRKYTVTGVDAIPGLEEKGLASNSDNIYEEAVKKLAKELGVIVVASGATDYVSDGEKVCRVTEGTPWMSRITGSGCMSSALLAAFLVRNGINLDTVLNALSMIGKCGEKAAKECENKELGTMSFRNLFIDEISRII